MLDVKVKPTKITFGEYMFIVKVNLDGRFFPSRIFSVAFETETETYEMETHSKSCPVPTRSKTHFIYKMKLYHLSTKLLPSFLINTSPTVRYEGKQSGNSTPFP